MPVLPTLRLALAVVFAIAATPAFSAAVDDELKTLQHDGLTRSYRIHVPATAKPGRPLPLVLVLHGGGANAPSFASLTRFSEEADANNFIAVYPNGTGRNVAANDGDALYSWNAGGCCGYAREQNIDDVGFLRAVVTAVERDYTIDKRRVFATGFSAGGMMAYRLACEASDMVAAVGVVAGVIMVPDCKPSAPVSVLHIHGTDDGSVPIEGLPERNRPPAAQSVAAFAGIDGCSAEAVEARPLGDVRSLVYPGCRNGAAVRYEMVEGGAHDWPTEETPGGVSTERVWKFFAEHPRR